MPAPSFPSLGHRLVPRHPPTGWGLPRTRSKDVLKGRSMGVPPYVAPFVDLEMSRIVVVGCSIRVGVEGGCSPRLRRAFAGAGTPGRSVCPGSGAWGSRSSSEFWTKWWKVK